MEKAPAHQTEKIKEPSPEPLTLEEKQFLINAWSGPVTNTPPLENIDTATNEDIKEWLHSSIESGVETFAKEIDLHPSEQLVADIQSALSVSEKAAAEKLYVEDVFQKLTDAKNLSRVNNPSRETRWDSWPTIMQENKTWNCVGASMLGSHLLQQSGVERFHGWPAGHVLNIVRLADGTWQYVDFNNNAFFEIHPEETEIQGVRSLVIRDPRTNYELVPILPESNIPAAILGNLSSMRREAEDDSKQDAGKRVAVAEMEKFEKEFKTAPFGNTLHKLFPHVEKVNNSEEINKERQRIKEVEKKEKEHRRICEPFSQVIADFTVSFNEQTLERVMGEARQARREIELLFINEDLQDSINTISQMSLGDELQEIIKIRLQQLKELKEEGNVGVYTILLEETFRKWKKM